MKKSIEKPLFTLSFLCMACTFFNYTPAQDWNEIVKRRASVPKDYDYYGRAISISGNYAIVGASQEDDDPERQVLMP